MAQLQFEQEISSDHEIRHLVVKNPNGRMWFTGWDRPEIRIRARVEVAGSQVPDEMKPQVEEDGHVMTIKCGHGFHPIPDDVDIHGIMENVVNIGEEIRESVNDFVSGLVTNMSGQSDKTPGKSGAAIDISLDSLQDLPEKLKDLKKRVLEKKHEKGTKPDHSNGFGMIRTELEVTVPHGVTVTGKSTNGVIGCESFQGQIDFKATNGPIRIKSVTGKMNLHSMNGPISLDSCHPAGLGVKTLNGPIKATFTGVNGEVVLKTLNGPIRAVFPADGDIALEIRTTSSPVKVAGGFQTEMRSQRRFTGHLGDGKNNVRIKTVSGPVTVGLSGEPAPRPAPSVESGGDRPDDVIHRMVQSGKISAEEAEQLKSVL